MKRVLACLVLGAFLMPLPAAAENSLVILSEHSALNSAELAIAGSNNTLSLLQDAPLGATAANTLRVSIEGDNNGGPAASAFTGAALTSGLMPGSLTQQGQGNAIDLGINGSQNLFAMLQRGDNNTIVASITGFNNQAAVQQLGGNNFASFSQNGIGNNVSIMQRSR